MQYFYVDETTIYVLGYMFAFPVDFFVSSWNSNEFSTLCPAQNMVWHVEHRPFVKSTDTSGNPGTSGVPSCAYQKWTGYAGISTSDELVEYYRIYYNGSWGSFIKL